MVFGVSAHSLTLSLSSTCATRTACEKSGVQYFVKVSFFHSRRTDELYQNVPLIELHGQCDKLLASSKIPYTILSASHFMSNALVAHHVS